MGEYQVSGISAINPTLLDYQLRSGLYTATYGFSTTPALPNTIVVQLVDNAPQWVMDSAAAICRAHNPNGLTSGQSAQSAVQYNTSDVLARYNASVLKGKTPDQIYTYFSGQISAWTTLAQAKSDLNAWLPLAFAGLAWLVAEQKETS